MPNVVISDNDFIRILIQRLVIFLKIVYLVSFWLCDGLTSGKFVCHVVAVGDHRRLRASLQFLWANGIGDTSDSANGDCQFGFTPNKPCNRMIQNVALQQFHFKVDC